MMRKSVLIFSITLIMTVFNCLTCSAAKNKLPVEGKGYIGTLPDLTRNYTPEEKQQDKIKVIPTPAKDFNSESEIKPAPQDDPAFVNIILKKDKTTKYANDINEFIPMLESITDMIEENQSVQLFNAKVFFFNKSVDYFRDRWAGKPESEFLSYKRLVELNTHAKSIALLRAEAEKYNPYLAYGSSGYIYNPNNIREQLGYLKTEIEQTILLLRESN